jgi:outer membrane protein TolC
MKAGSRRSWQRAAIAATGALLAACAVGPDYRAPEAPSATAYTEKTLPASTVAAPVRGGDAQSFEPGAEISAEWWKLFGSLALDKLMQTALAGHPTLDAAQAALRQAEENLNAQYSVLYPSVDAGLSARRQRISGATFGNPSIPNLHLTTWFFTRSTCGGGGAAEAPNKHAQRLLTNIARPPASGR